MAPDTPCLVPFFVIWLRIILPVACFLIFYAALFVVLYSLGHLADRPGLLGFLLRGGGQPIFADDVSKGVIQ